jgi:sensor histidine kinase YesM
MMKNIVDFYKQYRIHFILWAIYIAYESVLIGIFYGRFGKIENYITHFSLNISLFYLNIFILDKLEMKKNEDYFKILLTSITEILVYIPLLALLNQWFTEYNQPTAASSLGIDHRFILGAIYRSLFFILVSTGFWFLKRFLKEKQISENIEKERLKAIIEKESIASKLILAQNAYMRSQINPHFLFNTINFVHDRIRNVDSQAGELLLSLTKMIRYTVGLDHGKSLSLLGSEIEQVENLINLFQIREGHTLSIHLDYNDAALEQGVLPLSLLTLSENVFKHGTLNDPSAPAVISVNCRDDKIVISTKNKVSGITHPLSSKIGLKNLENRIQQHYKEQATFLHYNQGDFFITNLEMPIT